jgi:hypothetical protein
MIQTYKIQCNGCQSKISIPYYLKRLTCPDCGSILNVNEVEGVLTLFKIGDLPLHLNHKGADNQSFINEKKDVIIEIVKLEKEIALLDLKWIQEQEGFKIHTKWGDFIPTNEDTGKNILVFFMLVIGILIIYLSNHINLFFVSIMVPVILILGFLSTINIFRVNDNYTLAQNIYEAKRRGLQEKIRELKV